MTLRLTNTLTRQREPFVPLEGKRVTIYCCGVTVYDRCHLGHARSYLAWDVLRRYLIWRGYDVCFVQNFTDIDDKILRRADQEQTSMEAVVERNIAAYFEDMDALHIMRPDHMPRATQCLDGIRAMIGELEAKGAAYSADGDVYFAVLKHANYGKLSGRDLNEQQDNAGGRVASEEEARKQHAFDFALWKGAKAGEPSFPSPWGPGRPGWHIECSAMVRQELGDTIDIHLGGADLIFPHHENEIAQSEVVTGKALARYWLHNGMVNIGGEKMAKSKGNFTTIRALLQQGVSPMTLRLFVLQAQYRKPLDFSRESLDAAATGWKGLNAALGVGPGHHRQLGWDDPATAAATAVEEPALLASRERFVAAMDDDLNTAAALAELFELARPLRALANRLLNGDSPTDGDRALEPRWLLLRELAGVLGLAAETSPADPPPGHPAPATAAADGHNPAAAPTGAPTADPLSLDVGAIEAMVEQRRQAKTARDFASADRIRAELSEQGIELVDKPGGVTVWRRR